MTGIELIATERMRQVTQEGWTPEHDDEHDDGSLALAAVCYATPVRLYEQHEYAAGPAFRDPWPESWDDEWDKRYRYGERRTNPGNMPPDPDTYTDKERLDLLVKAGALIAAEIDRLQRAALKTANAIGQGSAACGASPAPTGCAANGSEVGAGGTAVDIAQTSDINAELTMAVVYRELAK